MIDSEQREQLFSQLLFADASAEVANSIDQLQCSVTEYERVCEKKEAKNERGKKQDYGGEKWRVEVVSSLKF